MALRHWLPMVPDRAARRPAVEGGAPLVPCRVCPKLVGRLLLQHTTGMQNVNAILVYAWCSLTGWEVHVHNTAERAYCLHTAHISQSTQHPANNTTHRPRPAHTTGSGKTRASSTLQPGNLQPPNLPPRRHWVGWHGAPSCSLRQDTWRDLRA